MVVASLLGSLTSQATYKHINDGSGMVDELTGQVQRIVLLSGAAWGALLLRERNAPARLACAIQLPPDIAGMIDNGDVDYLLDDTEMPAEQQLGRGRSISRDPIVLAKSTVCRSGCRTSRLASS